MKKHNTDEYAPVKKKQYPHLEDKLENKKKDRITLVSRFDKHLSSEQIAMISSLPKIVLNVSKISHKHIQQLKKNVQVLFERLTINRVDRQVNYLNYDSFLTAYAYYYLTWNCFKLVKLFSLLPTDFFLQNARDTNSDFQFADFGAGPLTGLIALWIAKPELRSHSIFFSCFDISQKALALGEKIFRELGTVFNIQTSQWQIKKIKGHFGKPTIPFDFYFSSNMFNEFLSDTSASFFKETKNVSKTILSYLKDSAHALIVEPGTPHGATIISTLRFHFVEAGVTIHSPCTHCTHCPLHVPHTDMYAYREQKHTNFSYAKKKWCHFVFPTFDASNDLKQMSHELNLPKENVTLSYFCFQKKSHSHIKTKNYVRIISDTIELKDKTVGKYACGKSGFLLLTSDKKTIQKMRFGDMYAMSEDKLPSKIIDKKTGAKIIGV